MWKELKEKKANYTVEVVCVCADRAARVPSALPHYTTLPVKQPCAALQSHTVFSPVTSHQSLALALTAATHITVCTPDKAHTACQQHWNTHAL